MNRRRHILESKRVMHSAAQVYSQLPFGKSRENLARNAPFDLRMCSKPIIDDNKEIL
jgi:hypothetical protein